MRMWLSHLQTIGSYTANEEVRQFCIVPTTKYSHIKGYSGLYKINIHSLCIEMVRAINNSKTYYRMFLLKFHLNILPNFITFSSVKNV